MNSVTNGLQAVAKRIVNAENNFIEGVMERGFTLEEAAKVLREYRKLKVVKLDAVNGVYKVKHGAYWDKDVLQKAVEL